jgi:cytochrome c oxidase cbb3-type subunit 3
MADMPTEFWSGYIVGITVLTGIALAWLVYNVFFSGGSDAEVAVHVWDESLREGTHPAPMWWFWLILATLAFSVIYLMLYPGLGSFKGALDWSQGGEVEAAARRFDGQFGPERERIAALPADQLGSDARAMRSGAHLFSVHCSACHGADAAGQAQLFPSLIDPAWQWGAAPEQIEQTLRAGRTAVMPPWQTVLQDDGVTAMTEFVQAMAEGRTDEAGLADVRTQYVQLCSACHGADGAGNALLGAPALNDGAWLYGGDDDAIRVSIADGRNGVMPPFGARLDAAQIKLLTAWLVAGAPEDREPPR